ncbi:MAG: zf-HC2 domain-containing protein [Desulfobacteraceae bacterium]|nr:zf-HC2 domain-containing protein [Desulfobacteraceae bacterium]MBC2756137.1 zf-HC2 domain-containing protein [Desulfobacteraceae bacterium]
MNNFDKHKDSDSFLWERYKTAGLKKPVQCPGDFELAAFIEGSLSAAQKASIEAHLAVCADCLDTVIEIRMQETEEKAAARERTKASWTRWKHLVYDFSFSWITPAVATILVIVFAAHLGIRTFSNQTRMHAAVSSSLSISDEDSTGFLSEEVTGGMF